MSGFRYVWGNRMRKFFDNPRAIVPFFKKRLYYNFVADSYLPYYKDYSYLGLQETIDYAIKHRVSILRFGDELFDMLLGIGVYFGNWRQQYSPEIAKAYTDILTSSDPRLLRCFCWNLILKSKREFAEMGIAEQWQFWTNSRVYLKDYLRKDATYGSALCFHPRYNPDIDFNALRDFFANKNIIIIASRPERFSHIALGRTTDVVGAPESDAFEVYKDIKRDILALIEEKGYDPNDVLILGSAAAASRAVIYELTIERDIVGWDTGQFFDLAYREIAGKG